MVVFEVPVNGCNPVTIVLGRRGTYNTQEVTFDLSYLVENYGAGTAVLMVKRSQDTSAYPAVVSQESNTLTWGVSDVDTYYSGSGECELMWYVDEGLAKTIIYPMVVMKDILQTTEEPPDGYENWIEHLTDLGAETQQNAQEAAQSASDAKASEDSAAESAQRAEDAAGMLVNVSATATTLNPGQPATAEYDDGVFKFGIPKGDKLTYADLTEADKEDLVQGPIKAAQDTAVEAVGTAKTNAVNAVGQAGTTAVTTVNQAGTTQVGNVQNEGATQVQAVEDKGAEVLETIPADYTELSNAVFDGVTGLDSKAPVIINTASGAIASFDDGADSMPIKKLVANIEPVQDLHGYDSPWPAGGGINKFDPDNFSQYYIGNENHNGHEYTEAGTYAIKAYGSGTNAYIYARVKNSDDSFEPAIYIVTNATSYGIVVTITSGQTLYVYDAQTHTATVSQDLFNQWKIQVALASTQPATYYPYSNICPISGHTGAEIEQTGKNLFDQNAATVGKRVNKNGYIETASDYVVSDYIPVKAGYSYYFQHIIGGTAYYSMFFYAYDKTNIATASIAGSTDASGTLLAPENAAFVRVNIRKSIDISTVQIALGNTAPDDYSPYTGNQISVTFPETIYGGKDEVISGKLTVSKAYVSNKTLATKTEWRKLGVAPYSFYLGRNIAFPGVLTPSAGGALPISSDYVYLQAGTMSNGQFRVTDALYIVDNRFDMIEDFLAYLAGSDGGFVYAIEPVEYDLTPQTLDTLYGTNNIWSSTGDTEVTYPADTKLYIDSLTKPDEDMIADTNIASGQYFTVNNKLYLSTAAIAVGASIIPGTNCTETNLAAALNALNT